MQVVAPTKDLAVIAVWSEGLYNFVNFFWLLGLTPPLTENDVSCDAACKIFHIAFVANQTGLLCMLKVVPVAFGNFTIDSLLYPSNFINKRVSILVV